MKLNQIVLSIVLKYKQIKEYYISMPSLHVFNLIIVKVKLRQKETELVSNQLAHTTSASYHHCYTRIQQIELLY